VGVIALITGALPTVAADKQPNIVVFWGDDIGQANLSAYTKGVIGDKTPNIDRVANEGMIFLEGAPTMQRIKS
jgi:hypothetical protein